MPNVTDADYISSFIAETLQAKGLLRSPVPLRRYRQGGEDPDSKLVFISEGEPALVVTVSPPEFPDVVAEECLRAAQMRSRLGDLGGPVLEPLDTGRVQTSSYAVLPFRKSFSRRRVVQWIHRNWARHHVLEWLLQIAHWGLWATTPRISARCRRHFSRPWPTAAQRGSRARCPLLSMF